MNLAFYRFASSTYHKNLIPPSHFTTLPIRFMLLALFLVCLSKRQHMPQLTEDLYMFRNYTYVRND